MRKKPLQTAKRGNSTCCTTLKLVVCTSPFWAGFGSSDYTSPKVSLPKDAKECIEDTAFMKAEHMQLLNEWRDQALRQGNRVYVAKNGKKWNISLQNTCLKCHNDYEQFCDKCHKTNNVEPYCWSCHVLPKGSK